jgi:ABC-2 type transport system permease protein
VIVYAMWFASLTIEFWIEGLWSMEELIPHAFRLGQYPDGIYLGMTQTIFLTVLPVIVIANYPTHSLLGNGSINMVWHSLTLMAVMLTVCHFQWRRALRRYSSAGS